MAKRKASKRKTRVQELGDTPTPEQMAKGGYERKFITHADTATKAMAHENCNDTIGKWRRKGYLSSTEITTIERMQEAWDVVHGQAKLTASYSELSGGPSSTLGCEGRQERILALRDALRDIEAQFKGVDAWYFVFERICRFDDHPLEVEKNNDRALLIVQFVCNIIDSRKMI